MRNIEQVSLNGIHGDSIHKPTRIDLESFEMPSATMTFCLNLSRPCIGLFCFLVLPLLFSCIKQRPSESFLSNQESEFSQIDWNPSDISILYPAPQLIPSVANDREGGNEHFSSDSFLHALSCLGFWPRLATSSQTEVKLNSIVLQDPKVDALPIFGESCDAYGFPKIVRTNETALMNAEELAFILSQPFIDRKVNRRKEKKRKTTGEEVSQPEETTTKRKKTVVPTSLRFLTLQKIDPNTGQKAEIIRGHALQEWRWNIVSARYVECASKGLQVSPSEKDPSVKCSHEFRVVAQPMVGYGEDERHIGLYYPDIGNKKPNIANVSGFRKKNSSWYLTNTFTDYAIHLFFELNAEQASDIKRILVNAKKVAESNGCSTSPFTLLVHPCLEQELVDHSRYYNEAGNFFYSFQTAEDRPNTSKSVALKLAELYKILPQFSKAAVMTSKKNNVPWIFFMLTRNRKTKKLELSTIRALDKENASTYPKGSLFFERKQEVFNRGIGNEKAKHESHETTNSPYTFRLQPRPDPESDSFDTLVRTVREFQTKKTYDEILNSHYRGLKPFYEAKSWPRQGSTELQSPSMEALVKMSPNQRKPFLTRIGIREKTYRYATSVLIQPRDPDSSFFEEEAAAKRRKEAQDLLKRISDAISQNRGKAVIEYLERQLYNYTDPRTEIRGLHNLQTGLIARYKVVPELASRIENPEIHTDFSVTCANCHLALMEHEEEIHSLAPIPFYRNYARVLPEKERLHVFFDEQYNEHEKNAMYVLNQFSFYRHFPIVSRRVVNETVQQIGLLKGQNGFELLKKQKRACRHDSTSNLLSGVFSYRNRSQQIQRQVDYLCRPHPE